MYCYQNQLRQVKKKEELFKCIYVFTHDIFTLSTHKKFTFLKLLKYTKYISTVVTRKAIFQLRHNALAHNILASILQMLAKSAHPCWAQWLHPIVSDVYRSADNRKYESGIVVEFIFMVPYSKCEYGTLLLFLHCHQANSHEMFKLGNFHRRRISVATKTTTGNT